MRWWKFKNQNMRPIGLDIGHDSIKMIQLVVDGGHIKVLAADKVRIDSYLEDDSEGRRNFIISAIRRILAGIGSGSTERISRPMYWS